MKISYVTSFAASLLFASATVFANSTDERTPSNQLLEQHQRRLRKKSKKGRGRGERELTLRIINQTFQQPFSNFFVMVHNEYTDPLYARGETSSDELATLAEEGDPSDLIASYTGANGVLSTSHHHGVAPGGSTDIIVVVDDDYPLVTIASMAVNTNDCFVSLNGAALSSGMVLNTPGNDSGSEANNEECRCVPGPACDGAEFATKGESCGGGEGFVHVHRGVQGIGDLKPEDVDWRNPMMRVIVM